MQVSEQEDKTCTSLGRCKLESFEDKHENEDDNGGGCGLSLSLSLQHPSTQRSNASSVSEISETISSSYRRLDISNCFSSSSGKPELSLDRSSNPSNGSKKGLTAGPIIGIVVGSLLVLLFVVLVFVFCARKGKKKEKSVATSGGRLPVILEKGTLPLCYKVYICEKLATLEEICTSTGVLMIESLLGFVLILVVSWA